jgi:hypothetical protein
LPYISNRFALERFLGLTKEEIAQNERLWIEENDTELQTPAMDGGAEMRMAGVSGAGMGADLGAMDQTVPTADLEGAIPQEGTPPDTATDLGGAAPPPAPPVGGT